MGYNAAESSAFHSDRNQNLVHGDIPSSEVSQHFLSEVHAANISMEASAQGRDPYNPNVPLSNFGRLSNNVFRSGRPNGILGIQEAVEKMWGDQNFDPNHAKKTTIVDLRAANHMAEEATNCAKLGVTHADFHMDAGKVQSPQFIQSVLDYIHQQKADGNKVLIHCHLGRDRTGTISAAYELTHDSRLEQLVKSNPDEAYKEALKTMTDDGFSPQQSPELAQSLKDFVNWKHHQ